jgi:ABC-2 type transport system ATP-binding protein
MKELLLQLDEEHFVLDLREPITTAPALEGFSSVLVDSHTLEIGINRSKDINEIFEELNKLGIRIKSMRNKSSRLEQLFVSLLNTPTSQSD